jgi:hypothetical protein
MLSKLEGLYMASVPSLVHYLLKGLGVRVVIRGSTLVASGFNKIMLSKLKRLYMASVPSLVHYLLKRLGVRYNKVLHSGSLWL